MLPSSTLEGCSYPARGRSTASTGLCRLLWWDGEGGGASDTFEALEDALHRLNATGHQWEQWSVQVQYWAREGNEGDLPDLYEVRMSDCAGKVFVVTSTGPSYALEADESFADCLDRLQHHNKKHGHTVTVKGVKIPAGDFVLRLGRQMGSARGMLVLEIEYTAIQNELVAAKTLEAFFSTVNSACGGLGGQWKRFWSDELHSYPNGGTRSLALQSAVAFAWLLSPQS